MLFRSAIRGWLWTGLCVLALSPTLSFAQSRTVVGVGEAFTVAITPPPPIQGATALRLYLNGVKVGADVALPPPDTAEALVQMAGIPARGAHLLEATAVSPAGESGRAARPFWVGPPDAPSLKLIQVTTVTLFEQVPRDGSVELRLIRASTEAVEVVK